MSQCTCADPQAVVRALTEGDGSVAGVNKKGLQNVNETLYGKNQEGDDGSKGEPGVPAKVDFCRWQAPEYGNKGEEWYTMAFRLAAIGIAIANGLAQQEIADKQQDLADSWYQQAKYKWKRYEATYLPLEVQLLNEVSTTPVPQLNCNDADARAQASVDGAYNSISGFISRQAKAHRLCIDSALVRANNHRQNTLLVDSRNYNYVDDRWYRDFKDDQRWNRRSAVLNLGRNLSSQALSYGQVANALYGQVGQQIERAAGGVMTALGYYGARNDTYYPTTYLGSGGGNIVNIGTPGNINPTGVSPGG